MPFDKRFLMLMAGAQMSVAGQMLQAADPDTVGKDDVIGKVLTSGGKAVTAYASGNDTSVDTHLKLVADAIYDYLGAT